MWYRCHHTTDMGADDQYDYSATSPFMEEFINPFPYKPFLSEFINPFPYKPFLSEFHDNYGKLWIFKECVKEWTFGVSRFKSYVYLLHCESTRAPFLPLNVSEEVTVLELFHKEYDVVITIQGKTLSGEDTKHIHSIVVKLAEEGPAFDIQGLLDSLSRASIELLHTEFEQKYVPWAKMDAETSVRRINSIF